MLGGFAGAALLLAGVGIAGVLAISVSRRTSEIGIRLALGADARNVVRMVIRQGMTLALAGLAIGVPAAFAATRLLRSLLFETAPREPALYAGAAIGLALVALVGSLMPALRATRVDPKVALSAE